MSILEKCNIPLNRLKALASNRGSWRSLDPGVPLECHALTLNTIELQLKT